MIHKSASTSNRTAHLHPGSNDVTSPESPDANAVICPSYLNERYNSQAWAATKALLIVCLISRHYRKSIVSIAHITGYQRYPCC